MHRDPPVNEWEQDPRIRGGERLDSSLTARWPFSTCWLSFINDLHAQICRDHLTARRNERVVLEGRVDRRSNPSRNRDASLSRGVAPLEFIDFRFAATTSRLIPFVSVFLRSPVSLFARCERTNWIFTPFNSVGNVIEEIKIHEKIIVK